MKQMKYENLVRPLATLLAIIFLVVLALYSFNFSSIASYHKAASSIKENEKLLEESIARRRTTLKTGMTKLDPFLVNMEAALTNINPAKVSAFVCLDGGRFGDIKAEYGAEAVDYAVLELCKYIKENVGSQKDALLCSVGDMCEEILFFLPNRESEEEITAFMDKLLANWKNVTIKFNGREIKVAFSAGVAFCPKHGLTTKALYEATGVALRASKENGGDRYTVYDASLLEPKIELPTGQEEQEQSQHTEKK